MYAPMASGIALLMSLAQIDVPEDTMCEIFGRFDRQIELYWQRTRVHVEKQQELDQTESRFDQQLQEFEPKLQAALAQRLSGSAQQNTHNPPTDAARAPKR